MEQNRTEWIADIQSDKRGFWSLFGMSPDGCADAWKVSYQPFKHGTRLIHLLWAFLAVRVCVTEDVLCSMAGVSQKTFPERLLASLTCIFHSLLEVAREFSLVAHWFEWAQSGLNRGWAQVEPGLSPAWAQVEPSMSPACEPSVWAQLEPNFVSVEGSPRLCAVRSAPKSRWNHMKTPNRGLIRGLMLGLNRGWAQVEPRLSPAWAQIEPSVSPAFVRQWVLLAIVRLNTNSRESSRLRGKGTMSQLLTMTGQCAPITCVHFFLRHLLSGQMTFVLSRPNMQHQQSSGTCLTHVQWSKLSDKFIGQFMRQFYATILHCNFENCRINLSNNFYGTITLRFSVLSIRSCTPVFMWFGFSNYNVHRACQTVVQTVLCF